MAFIAMSQNLNMGGTETGVVVGPSTRNSLMLVFVGRVVTLGWLTHELLSWWM